MKPTGVYMSGAQLRFVEAGTFVNRDRLSLASKKLTLDSPEPQDRAQRIKEFVQQNRIKTGRIILEIPRTQFSVRYLSLPTLKDDEIRHMVDNEVAHLFPYRPEELVYDHLLIHKDADGYSRVVLFTALRKTITEACELFKQAGIIPESISVSTISLYYQFLKEKRPGANYLVIYRAHTWLELLHISDGKLTFSRAFPLKGDEPPDKLKKSVEITVTALKDTGYRVDTVIMNGDEGVNLGEFTECIKNTLQLHVETDRALRPIDGLIRSGQAVKYALNLIPEEFKNARQKSRNKRALLYFGVLLSINIACAVNIVIFRKKVRNEYLGWLLTEINRIEAPAVELQKKMVNMQLLAGYLASGRLTLAVLSQVYSASPRNINLSSLDIIHTEAGKNPVLDENRVLTGSLTVKGRAPNSEIVLDFIDSLKKSRIIASADVNYIKRSASTEQGQDVDFQLKAEF